VFGRLAPAAAPEEQCLTGYARLNRRAAPPARWDELMQAAQRGDDGSYRILLNVVRPWLCRYYAGRLPWPMVEDAVQDAMLAVHEARHAYDSSRPFVFWLAAIARYKLIDRLRGMRRTRFTVTLDDVSVEDHGGAVLHRRCVEQLLGGLKPAQSRAIELVKLTGCTIEEAARHTGQSVPLVKVNIHRGMARMARAVAGATEGGATAADVTKGGATAASATVAQPSQSVAVAARPHAEAREKSVGQMRGRSEAALRGDGGDRQVGGAQHGARGQQAALHDKGVRRGAGGSGEGAREMKAA
jgi:RNA polymerase sigma-70 factor (ECF subfamily)